MPTNNLTRRRPELLAKPTSATNPLTTSTQEIVTFSIMDICLDHLDLETRSLAIRMLRQDAKEALENMRGKQGQSDYDSKVALDAYLADLEAQTALALDRAMAQSMVQAIHHDERIIAAAVAQEEQAASDRAAALQLHRSGNLPKNPKPSKPEENAIIDDELREKLEARYNNRPRDDIHDTDDHRRKRTKTRPCMICQQEMDCCDLTRLPCSHEYCQGCLKNLFTMCLTDETMYPPRCCKQIIPETEMQIRISLGGELLGKFLARKIEMETPNRTYCHQRDCTTFIPPQGIQGDCGTCPKCQSKTCCICKEAAHQGSDCPQDGSAQILLELGAREGWKRCVGCGRMVELGYGCNHITCRCGAQFCYVCGAPWKEEGDPEKCKCALFDEDELAQQAAQAAAEQPEFHQQPPVRQEQIVQQHRNHIVQNYACQHAEWFFRWGHYKCRNCGDRMSRFIHECQQCQFRACTQCKRHRL